MTKTAMPTCTEKQLEPKGLHPGTVLKNRARIYLMNYSQNSAPGGAELSLQGLSVF